MLYIKCKLTPRSITPVSSHKQCFRSLFHTSPSLVYWQSFHFNLSTGLKGLIFWIYSFNHKFPILYVFINDLYLFFHGLFPLPLYKWKCSYFGWFEHNSFLTFAICMIQAIGYFSVCLLIVWTWSSILVCMLFCHVYFLIFKSLILSPVSELLMIPSVLINPKSLIPRLENCFSVLSFILGIYLGFVWAVEGLLLMCLTMPRTLSQNLLFRMLFFSRFAMMSYYKTSWYINSVFFLISSLVTDSHCFNFCYFVRPF